MSRRNRRRIPTAWVERTLPLPPDQAWSLVADARHHARWVPLTRVDLARPSASGAKGASGAASASEDTGASEAASASETTDATGAREATGTGPAPGWVWCDAAAEPQPGDLVVAVSGPRARRGGGGLVDRMRIERYEQPLDAVPGTAVFVKLGPVLGGTARIVVTGDGPGRSRVGWSEEVFLRGLPRQLTQWIGAVLVHGMLALTLHRVRREAMNHS